MANVIIIVLGGVVLSNLYGRISQVVKDKYCTR